MLLSLLTGAWTLTALPPVHAEDDPTLFPVTLAGSQVKALGESTFPDVYAEVVVDEQAGRLRLDVTALGAAADSLADAAGSVPVDLRVVPNSYASQMETEIAVVRDIDYWAGQGVVVNAVTPDEETSLVEIGVEQPTSVTTALLLARYGADKVSVAQAAVSVGQASRTADSTPYNGGIRVKDADGWTCTAGIPSHSGSAPASTSSLMVLAGHCFPHNTPVYHNGVRIGTAVRSIALYTTDQYDIEYISMSSSRNIWETNTVRARGDGSVTTLAVGSSVCHSGAATDKRCGKVSAVNGTNRSTDPRTGTVNTFAHQTTVTSTSLLAAGGDSGGPWFTTWTSSTGVRYYSAVGIHSSAAGSTYTCPTQLGTSTSCSNSATYTQQMDVFNRTNWWPNY